jgi:hypothetical protein
MSQSKPTVTINQAFQEFLAEQEARLSPATLSKYENILDLLGACLERYFTVTRVEPGKLWLDPFVSGDREIGPVPVPREISD